MHVTTFDDEYLLTPTHIPDNGKEFQYDDSAILILFRLAVW
jgi:hypothetical protein